MNLALPAIILFLLALPGIILRYMYRKGNWKAPLSIKPLTEEIAYSLVLAVILHIIWTTILFVFGVRFDLFSLLILLTGISGKDDLFLERALMSVSRFPYRISFYFLSLYVISAFGGLLGHFLIRKSKLDRKFSVFRFNNEWYYLFLGGITGFNGKEDISDDIAFTYISAVVNHGNDVYLYRGILEEYYFDRNGELDRIVLIQAHRRVLSEDKIISGSDGEEVTDEKYYNIKGNYFILRYSEIKTLNLEYFIIREESTSLHDHS